MGEHLTVNEELMLKEVHTKTESLINAEFWKNYEEIPHIIKMKKVLNGILAASRMSLNLYGVYYGTDKASFYGNWSVAPYSPLENLQK